MLGVLGVAHPPGQRIGRLLTGDGPQAAAAMLEEMGVSVTVADARFCKPLDTELVLQLSSNHAALLTVEEGSIGGFASHVTQYMLSAGLLDGSTKLRCMYLPDENIEHGAADWQLEQAGLSPKDIAATVLQMLDRKREALEVKASKQTAVKTAA